MKNKRKIIFLTYIPSPYRVDFFNELSKIYQLNVVYYNNPTNNLGWVNNDKKHNYYKYTLFKKSKLKGFLKLFNILYNNRNEIIVIGGYAKMVEIVAILYLRLLNIDFILNSDGGFITDINRPKKFLKKALINSAKYWLSSGSNTTTTLEFYGADSSRIFEYHFTSVFDDEVLKTPLSINILDKLKNELNLNSNAHYLVFVGQLIERKGIDILIRALELMRNNGFELLIIGEGDEKGSLEEYSENAGLAGKVHFLGKRNKNEILDYLSVSDIFVFPSREDIWGLVLNEAIGRGLVLVSTNKVGASYSLIENGINGFIFENEDYMNLANILDKLSDMNLEPLKERSLRIAENFTIERMVLDHSILFDKIQKEKLDSIFENANTFY